MTFAGEFHALHILIKILDADNFIEKKTGVTDNFTEDANADAGC